MNLDPAFYPALVVFARELNTDPEYFLRLFWLESRLDPKTHRSGSRYYGLNQVDAAWLRKRGIDPTEYLTWPASAQLTQAAGPFLAEMIHTYLKAPTIRSPGVLEALNLAPARVRDGAPGNVLYAKTMDCSAEGAKADPYCANRGLDRDSSGTITVADIDALMESFQRMGDWPIYLQARAELEKAQPASHAPSTIATAVGPTVVGVALGGLVVGTLAYTAYSYARR